MRKQARPAIDSSISPTAGVARNGQPLSYNRAPRPELAPWIARLYYTKVDAPDDYRLDCGLFNETAFFRIQVKGDWRAETASGPLRHGREALYFGPQSRLMPVSVTGGFCSIGISMRPGTCHVLKGPKVADYMDRIVTCNALGMDGDAMLARFDAEMAPEEALCTLEGLLEEMIVRRKARQPDPLTVRFETALFIDPTFTIKDFVRDCGIEQRQLERTVRRDFGLPPKQVLRRVRALDMASHLRGVADHSEAETLMLRYYDQSHLIREFTEFFGMTPSQFVERPQPLLTLALESRQARRLEALDRIEPGAVRPWQ